MDRYWFPAVFQSCAEGGYTVTFPNLPGIVTEGDTVEDALAMARDALELHLYGMEKDEEEIPRPSFSSAATPIRTNQPLMVLVFLFRYSRCAQYPL